MSFKILFSLFVASFGMDVVIPVTTQQTCLRWDWDKNLVMHGSYVVRDEPSWYTATCTAYGPTGEQLFRKVGNKGAIAFTTFEGTHSICWQGSVNGEQTASTVRIFFNVSENDFLQRKDDKEGHLAPIEQTLKLVESKVAYTSIHMKVAQSRGEALEELNESIAQRIPFFSFLFVSTVIIFGVVQMWYLKLFFQKKKLI